MTGEASVAQLQVTIAGTALPPSDIFDLVVEQDLQQPDAAMLVLANESTRYSESVNLGEAIEVKIVRGAGEPATVFTGEIVGIEPIFDTRSRCRVVLRAFNKLHLLARGKKSLAYINVTDKDIVDKICQAHSLTPDYGTAPPTVHYEHVYQHNQTDLELLRLRAARIGYELSVVDTKLCFRKRDDADSGIKLDVGAADGLEGFFPRLSTTGQVAEVRVRAYDAHQKQEIVASARPPGRSKLGEKLGTTIATRKGAGVTVFECDAPVETREQAEALAASLLRERMMSFVTGRAWLRGNPAIRVGIVVTICAHDRKFDGKYYVVAVKHRYVHEGARNGFTTEFQFRRDAVGDPQQARADAQERPPKRQPKSQPKPKPQAQADWIEMKLVGEDGKPIANERYRIKLPDGKVYEGYLGADGKLRIEGIDRGTCELSFPDLDHDAWVPA
jgi:phage protein D